MRIPSHVLWSCEEPLRFHVTHPPNVGLQPAWFPRHQALFDFWDRLPRHNRSSFILGFWRWSQKSSKSVRMRRSYGRRVRGRTFGRLMQLIWSNDWLFHDLIQHLLQMATPSSGVMWSTVTLIQVGEYCNVTSMYDESSFCSGDHAKIGPFYFLTSTFNGEHLSPRKPRMTTTPTPTLLNSIRTTRPFRTSDLAVSTRWFLG